jgi:hypothetical protein
MSNAPAIRLLVAPMLPMPAPKTMRLQRFALWPPPAQTMSRSPLALRLSQALMSPPPQALMSPPPQALANPTPQAPSSPTPHLPTQPPLSTH